jgi:cellulose biosynthesis protein BcsQ
MNADVIKLALDAGLLNYIDLETPRHYFINGNADTEEVEEFANEMVNRCAKLIEKDVYDYTYIDCPASYNDGYVDGLNRALFLIKEHFSNDEY